MPKWLLYLLLFCLMMVWGFNVIAIKVLVTYAPPILITAFRILAAGMVGIVFLLLRRSLTRLSFRQFLQVGAAALFGVFGHHIFLAVGLKATTAANGGLILGLVPLMTAICAMIFLGDRITKLRLAGIILGFVGVGLIVLSGREGIGAVSSGDLLVLGAVVTQAISFVLIKKMTDHIDSSQLTGLMLLVGSVLLFGASLVIEPGQMKSLAGLPGYVWVAFSVSAVLATGLGHMLYNYAIQQMGAGESAIFINFTPFFAIIGSALFLGESIQFTQILGFLLIVVGVILGTGAVETFVNMKRFPKGNISTPSS